MKIRVIGGGPAGLFFAYLMGRAGAGHDIRVYERDLEGATYGWGLKPASFVVDDLLVHHVAKHQGQIRRNISQFNDARAKA